jgi:hypothetical protein
MAFVAAHCCYSYYLLLFRMSLMLSACRCCS